MERSHTALRQWLQGFSLMASSRRFQRAVRFIARSGFPTGLRGLCGIICSETMFKLAGWPPWAVTAKIVGS